MKQNTTYKQTELGLIPEDWEVKKLGEIGKIITGSTPPTANLEYYENGTFDFIGPADLNSNKYIDEAEKKVTINGLNAGRVLKKHSVLVTCIGSTIGKIGINKNICITNQQVNAIETDKNNSDFIYYSILERNGRLKLIAGEQAVPVLNKTEFSKFKIPLPPLPEQKKIADCLSTWDSAIEKQSQLINALTQRKKALMQQLLTGKKRLPGFSDEWKEVKLGDIGEISSAGVDKNIVEGEKPIRLLNFLDVYRRDFLYSHEQNHWVTANDYKIEKCSIKKGDVFFTPSSEVPNDIAISAVAMENFDNVVYSYHIVRFRIKEKWDLRYKAYAFKTDEFFKQAQRICDGSGQRYVISQNNFKNIKIKIPSLEEQTAIAEILATADRELQLQKEKLAQLQTQKKGLMQVLLTGKKRLIN